MRNIPRALAAILITAALGCAQQAETATTAPVATDPPAEETPAEQAPTESDPMVSNPEETQPAAQSPEPPAAQPTAAPVDPWHGNLGDPSDAGLVALNANAFVRDRRRMDIGQLSTAIERATGGIQWVDGKGNDKFELLASTLGRPDYLSSVDEDLSAGPVFQKFLGDAARSVCTKLADKEVDLPAEERVLMVHAGPEDTLKTAPEAVEKNLTTLLLRYHGVQAQADDPALQRWRWLFESVTHITDNPVQGWRAVCIGMLEHPDFYSY